MKQQYRPVSADFTKLSGGLGLTSMFANNDNEKPSANNNVLLITYKKAVTEVDGSPPSSPASQPTAFHRAFNRKSSSVTGESAGDGGMGSSADSWESGSEAEVADEPLIPLASEDSDLGDGGDFESFSGTEEEEEDLASISATSKSGEENGRLSFLRTISLREKLRESRWTLRRGSEKELSPVLPSPPSVPEASPGPESRLSRLFSLRRSVGPCAAPTLDQSMPRVAEEDEGSREEAKLDLPPTPSLAPSPLFLTAEQTKRRHIITNLVLSENNYVSSLQRLVTEYRKPLEETQTPILSQAKVATLFHGLSTILSCHMRLRAALTNAVAKWDKEERIGDIFVASFSKSSVLEIYSDFINNFNQAMELAKSESKRKSAFADFLQVKQITAADRLNFFGLMVKPIQRFPQFILLLQDLLKETPPGHHDRMALQLALTTLESLAEMLNERKRESEQAAAFQAKLRSTGSKLGKTDQARVLLREDDVQQLEFNNFGQVSRSKSRRLLLLNDQVVCVAVSGRPSEVEIGPSLGGSGERLTLKWSAGVEEVSLVEGSTAGTLARMTVAGSVSASTHKRSSLGRASTPGSMQSSGGKADSGQAENLAQDMADLMHDFDVVSRIGALVGSLKCPYPGLTSDTTASILSQIQASIRQKDEEMSWLDKSCLQLAVRRRDKVETLTFQMQSPSVKEDWVVEHRLSRLALDPGNSPGWDILDSRMAHKLPLFSHSLVSYKSPVKERQSEVACGASYTLLVPTPTRTLRPVTYVWANTTDGRSSQLRIYSAQTTQLKELGTISLSSCCVKATVFVPAAAASGIPPSTEEPLRADLVWVATDDLRILFYAASDPERGSELGRIVLPSQPVSLVYHCGQVWVGLQSGCLQVFRRSPSGSWDTSPAISLVLGSDPVTALAPIQQAMLASVGREVMLLDAWTSSVLRSFAVGNEPDQINGSTISLDCLAAPGHISHLAVAGVGLWVASSATSTVALYHTESFIHMQDIDIATNVRRVLAARDLSNSKKSIYVTALSAAKGLLWVGTNVGIALTIPLPRLEGVPIISGKANISYHAHFGPVRMFLPLQPKVHAIEPTAPTLGGRRPVVMPDPHSTIQEEEPESKPTFVKQNSDGHLVAPTMQTSLTKQYSSPMLGQRRSREPRDREVSPALTSAGRRSSKTLPRGFSLSQAIAEGGDSVYGLYGDLLNVRDYDCDSTELGRTCQEIHRSDPELDTIPYRVSTLDRRVTMKSQRPRSLDLSSWSVESRGSCHTTSSSDTSSEYASPSVSRNASFISNRSSFVGSIGPSSSVDLPPVPGGGVGGAGNGALRRRPSCRQQAVRANSKLAESATGQRTVTTLMGGRGYIQWRKGAMQTGVNNSDAYLVIWDHRL